MLLPPEVALKNDAVTFGKAIADIRQAADKDVDRASDGERGGDDSALRGTDVACHHHCGDRHNDLQHAVNHLIACAKPIET